MNAVTELAASAFADSPPLGQAESLRSKLKRYLFPVGILQAPQGDVFLQRSIFQGNVEALRRHSGHFVRVHGVLTGLLVGAVAVAASGSAALAVAGLALLVPEMALFVFFASLAIAMRLD